LSERSSSDRAEDVRRTQAFRHLKRLDLSSTEVEGTLEPFGALTSLEDLELSYCHAITGPLAPLTTLTKLRRLGLASCPGLRAERK